MTGKIETQQLFRAHVYHGVALLARDVKYIKKLKMYKRQIFNSLHQRL